MPFARALFVGSTLTLCSSTLSAQGQSTRRPPTTAEVFAGARFAYITVTDPLNRFVTGIEKEYFVIVENGVRRRIIGFSDANSAISIAIVSETLLDVSSSDRPNIELIQTRSVPDAVQQLVASKNPRKALVITTGEDTRGLPSNIEVVVQANPDIVSKLIVELRSQYVIQFESSDVNATVEVILQQPQGLPPLRPHLDNALALR
jgi:hypothetical protein